MTDFGIYTKNADIQALAGVNAGTTEKATAATDIYVLNVEAVINVKTNKDWSTAWTASKLDSSLKLVLTMTGAAGCAKIVANANPTGYFAREFETLLDFLNSLYDEGIQILKGADEKSLIIT